MIINDRECEGVKIGDYTFYMISRFKGKEFIKVTKTKMAKSITTGSKEDGKVKIELGIDELYEDLLPLFPVFCMQVEKGEEKIEPTEEFVLDLDTELFNKVMDKISDLLVKAIGGEKKVQKQSKE